ncbi:MAG TPA: hypothetical protein VKV37_00710 [Ktedonobacteraceae bacterium]|nr:hypothetical protein [Ktedonobacteraceae bacterium]
MAKVTRRGFIMQSSASIATIGMLAALPTLSAAPEATEAAVAELPAVTNSVTELPAVAAPLSAPLIAHVSDLATGEISLLVGTQEITYRDSELVTRLLRAVH